MFFVCVDKYMWCFLFCLIKIKLLGYFFVMSYLDTTINYIKTSVESIRSSFIAIKEILVSIGNILGTIIDILGFIGFRVLLLLIITAFVAWILNLVSPISKKTNYFVAVGVVLWIGLTAKLPIQVVILKYILIILSPFLITKIVNFVVKNFEKILKISLFYFKKFLFLLCDRIRNGNLKLQKNLKIGIVFDEDLPTINEIEDCKKNLKCMQYEPVVLSSKNISLVDDKKRIVFSKKLQIEQFVDTLTDKKIKVMLFWGNSFIENGLINDIDRKYNFRKQKKLVIGNGSNGKLFNFLQTKWNWKVFYGVNGKNLGNLNIEELVNDKKEFKLGIVNDFKIENDYFLKKVVVGGDLQSIIDSIGTASELNFKNKILFFDYNSASKVIFYKNMIHLAEFIIKSRFVPICIVLGKIGNDFDYFEIIDEFDSLLRGADINFPIFQSNINYLLLNEKHIIKIQENDILLDNIL